MRLRKSWVGAAWALVLSGTAVCPARGQTSDPDTSRSVRSLVVPGTPEDERVRLDQLLGRAPTDGYLLRSPATLLSPMRREGTGPHVVALDPQTLIVSNSRLPFSLNQGPLFAGRGVSAAITGGARATWGRLSLVVAPTLVYEQNRAFILPDSFGPPQARSWYASRWHTPPFSMDLPIRFGDRTRVLLDPGQSSLTYDAGPVAFGVATENRWWGPGIRDAIVLSTNAAGFPHLFVRTARPLRTRAGAFEAILLAGGLQESGYFDSVTTNDVRSISGLAVTFVPRGEPGLTLGAARTVIARSSGWAPIPLHLFDVFFRSVGHPTRLGEFDTSAVARADQVFSLFARWVFPRDGLEAYVEWARYELPSSLRQLLTAPEHTQGYTLGLQWAAPLTRHDAAIRLQVESSYLEQDPTYRDMPIGSWYSSRSVPQGYTQRGKVLGAAMGPGSSGQWFAVDYVGRRTEAGVFAGRIRWEDDALYRVKGVNPNWNIWCSHDVSVFAGVRGGVTSAFGTATAALTYAQRYNVYFQHFTQCGALGDPTMVTDARNATLEIRLSPRLR